MHKPIYNKVTALLVVAFLTFTLGLGSIAILIINSGGIGANPFATPLFSLTGAMNENQAADILTNINGGNVVNRNLEFRLFSDTGLATTDVGRLSRLNWRMTNVDGDRVTFWASGAYRNSQFRQTTGVNTQVYSGSTLHNNINNNFASLVSGWAPSVVSANIPTLGVSSDHGSTSDRMWLPRVADVENSGAWSLNSTSRQFATNTFNANAWLRTPTRSGVYERGTYVFHAREYSDAYSGDMSMQLIDESILTWDVVPGTVYPGATFIEPYFVGEEDHGTPYSKQIVVTSVISYTMISPAVAATVAVVTSGGAIAAGAATTPVDEIRSIRPAIHVSLSALQQAAQVETLFNSDSTINPYVARDLLRAIESNNFAGGFRLFPDTGPWAAVLEFSRIEFILGRTSLSGPAGGYVTMWAPRPISGLIEYNMYDLGQEVINDYFSSLNLNIAGYLWERNGNRMFVPQFTDIGTNPGDINLVSQGLGQGDIAWLSDPAPSGSVSFVEMVDGGGAALVTRLLDPGSIGAYVIPGINIRLQALREAAGTIPHSRVFVTSADTAPDNILMNTLFPTQIEYRTEIRVGDWVLSIHSGNPIMREVDEIGSGSNPMVTLGRTVGTIVSPEEGLAELVNMALALDLERSDFNSDADWNTFTEALSNAENALFHLDNLTPAEITTLAEILRAALVARS